jgi:hypothetical protein
LKSNSLEISGSALLTFLLHASYLALTILPPLCRIVTLSSRSPREWTGLLIPPNHQTRKVVPLKALNNIPVKEIAIFKDSRAFVLHEGDMATDENVGISAKISPI